MILYFCGWRECRGVSVVRLLLLSLQVLEGPWALSWEIQESTRLKYEPALEPLHISVMWLFIDFWITNLHAENNKEEEEEEEEKKNEKKNKKRRRKRGGKKRGKEEKEAEQKKRKKKTEEKKKKEK